ncbi:Uncharacterized conserved protein UCP006173 [Candidatus Magnetomorum sp. HK-1]|nr:Uncharacterized conserved protein UCP006173 [Candidatus Magnetomorum sp. HK-1]
MKTTPSFWKNTSLEDLSYDQWEKLCDGCGQCCIHKLLNEDGTLYLTDLACKNLDTQNIWCRCYDRRNDKQTLCTILKPINIVDNLNWLPETCAYRRLYEKKSLPDWHPLISNDPDTVYKSGHSIQGKVISERLLPVINWEDHIVPDDYFHSTSVN